MAEGQSKGGDLLGIKPAAEAVHKVASAAIEGASAVWSCICLPAAEEVGLLLRDRVSYWRACNLLSMTKKLEKKLAEKKIPAGAHAHPRLVHAIVEQGGWVEDSLVQDMWVGLLSSSCTDSGDDDSNLIFVNMLGSLTKLQAKVLKHACEQAIKYISPSGLIHASPLHISVKDLGQVTEENDVHRLDRELDYLRAAGLLEGSMSSTDANHARLTPSSLALHMYVRCQGSRVSPVEFFKLLPTSAASAAPPATSPAS